jgi:hypothetical protein
VEFSDLFSSLLSKLFILSCNHIEAIPCKINPTRVAGDQARQLKHFGDWTVIIAFIDVSPKHHIHWDLSRRCLEGRAAMSYIISPRSPCDRKRTPRNPALGICVGEQRIPRSGGPCVLLSRSVTTPKPNASVLESEGSGLQLMMRRSLQNVVPRIAS